MSALAIGSIVRVTDSLARSLGSDPGAGTITGLDRLGPVGGHPDVWNVRFHESGATVRVVAPNLRASCRATGWEAAGRRGAR